MTPCLVPCGNAAAGRELTMISKHDGISIDVKS